MKEEGAEVLFLTSDDVKDKHWKEKLAGSRDNDALGHGAIYSFFDVSQKDYVTKENQSFWNGELPQEIKYAWNSGKLDGLLQFLQDDDLTYIQQNAPYDFQAWIFKTRFSGDVKAMQKDNDVGVRQTGYMLDESFGKTRPMIN